MQSGGNRRRKTLHSAIYEGALGGIGTKEPATGPVGPSIGGAIRASGRARRRAHHQGSLRAGKPRAKSRRNGRAQPSSAATMQRR